jgi:hypothetical protein
MLLILCAAISLSMTNSPLGPGGLLRARTHTGAPPLSAGTGARSCQRAAGPVA